MRGRRRIPTVEALTRSHARCLQFQRSRLRVYHACRRRTMTVARVKPPGKMVICCRALRWRARLRRQAGLHDQVANDRNSGICLCPFFDPGAVVAAIDDLPDTLAADESTWTLVYDFDGKPAWLWPHGQIPPSKLSTTPDGSHRGLGVSFGLDLNSPAVANAAAGTQPAQRSVPPTRTRSEIRQASGIDQVPRSP
jgi:hypothetical protein